VLRTEPTTIILRFRSLLVDRPHPKAQQEIVSTVLSSSNSPRDFSAAVVNEFVLLLIYGLRVLAWNWVTGKCHARLDSDMRRTFTAAVPLQRTAFMTFRQTHNNPILEIFTYSAEEPTSDKPSPIRCAIYGLPTLQIGVEMVVQFRINPPPFQYSHLVHPDSSSLPIETPSSFRRPFEVQETSRILVLAICVRTALGDEQSRDLAIFAPLRTFTKFTTTTTNLDLDAPRGDPPIIPPSEWMRSSQVLADVPLLSAWCGHYVYGNRVATLPLDSSGRANLCVYDFNPAIISYSKHHRRDSACSENQFPKPGGEKSAEELDMIQWTEGNANVGLVSRKLDLIDTRFFQLPVRGGASFLASVSTEEIDVGPNEIDVMIDDERVLVMRVGRSSSLHN